MDKPGGRFLARGRWEGARRGGILLPMTPPRRLLLIASPSSRGDTAPVRRYRLGRVLMGPEQLIGERPEGGTWSGARERCEEEGRWRA